MKRAFGGFWYDDTFVGLSDQSMGELWSPVTNIGGRSLQEGGFQLWYLSGCQNRLNFLMAGNIKELSTGASMVGKAKEQNFCYPST